MFIVSLRPNWYTVQKLSSSLTVSTLPITNTGAFMPFTVTSEVPFRAKNAQYFASTLHHLNTAAFQYCYRMIYPTNDATRIKRPS